MSVVLFVEREEMEETKKEELIWWMEKARSTCCSPGLGQHETRGLHIEGEGPPLRRFFRAKRRMVASRLGAPMEWFRCGRDITFGWLCLHERSA